MLQFDWLIGLIMNGYDVKDMLSCDVILNILLVICFRKLSSKSLEYILISDWLLNIVIGSFSPLSNMSREKILSSGWLVFSKAI